MTIIASIWLQKYPQIFVLGHYLLLETHSFPRASLSENCSLLRTDNVRGQISEHIFAPNGCYCLYNQLARPTNAIFSFYWTFAPVYVLKPDRVLKFLSVSALIMLYRLYTDQWNRCEETENCFNLGRTKEEIKFFTLFNSVLF